MRELRALGFIGEQRGVGHLRRHGDADADHATDQVLQVRFKKMLAEHLIWLLD
jgi:hypothetical protein